MFRRTEGVTLLPAVVVGLMRASNYSRGLDARLSASNMVQSNFMLLSIDLPLCL